MLSAVARASQRGVRRQRRRHGAPSVTAYGGGLGRRPLVPGWLPDHGPDVRHLPRPFAGAITADLWTVHPDGTGLARLTHTGKGEYAFSGDWSPDETRVVLSHYQSPDDNIHLATMNADGSRLTTIYVCPSFCDAATWGTQQPRLRPPPPVPAGGGIGTQEFAVQQTRGAGPSVALGRWTAISARTDASAKKTRIHRGRELSPRSGNAC